MNQAIHLPISLMQFLFRGFNSKIQILKKLFHFSRSMVKIVLIMIKSPFQRFPSILRC